MNRIKVQTASEFLADGPPIGSREYKRELAEEQRQARKREALAEQRRNAYQRRLAELSPLERALEELDALMAFTDNDVSAVEREYARLTGKPIETVTIEKPGVEDAIERLQQRIKELQQ